MPEASKKRKRLDKEESRVVIVGAGLAGVSVALSLERAGFSQIEIFERDGNFEQQKEGYGLTLSYNPKGPLAILGVLEEIARQDCPSRSHYLFQPDGSIMGYFGNTFQKHRGNGQRGNLRVPRKVLRKLLLNKLRKTTIHWGQRLHDYEFDACTGKYNLQFTSTQKVETVDADLLVAADGIHSAILSKLYGVVPSAPHKLIFPKVDSHKVGLRNMGVRLILGIAEFSHTLLKERGFYTLDGKHRLFTMPYSSNKFDASKTNRIMWQLSFATGEDYEESLDAESLFAYVVETCKEWHQPVLDMVQATPIDAVWGTDLMDRDPHEVWKRIQQHDTRRLVVVGDALHSMSPFKGAGANQALTDGPLLATCLQRASIDAAVKAFWRETVQRTAPVVAASRSAAKELHAPSVLLTGHGFAGVQRERIPDFLDLLRAQNIGANLGAQLDEEVTRALTKTKLGEPETKWTVSEKEQERALELARSGSTEEMRRQSLAKHSESIRTARDTNGRSCLHLAVEAGDYETCKWLLFEAGCDPTTTDLLGKGPSDFSTDKKILELLDIACADQTR